MLSKQGNLQKNKLYKYFIYVFSIVVLTLIAAPKIQKGYKVIIGKPSPYKVVAEYDIEAIDMFETQRLRNEKFINESNVYIFLKNHKKEFQKKNEDLRTQKSNFKINDLIDEIYLKGYVENDFTKKDYKKGIILLIKNNDLVRRLEITPEKLSEFAQKIIVGKNNLKKFLIEKHLLDIAKKNDLIRKIRPNIFVDNKTMLRLFYEKQKNIEPVKIIVNRGETIVEKSQIVNYKQELILRKMQSYRFNLKLTLITIILITLIIIFCFINYYLKLFISVFDENYNNYTIFFILLILPAFLLKFYLIVINSSFYLDYLFSFVFLIPIESSAILAVILLFRRSGIVIALLNAFIAALVFSVYSTQTLFNNPGYSFLLGFTIFFSSMTGVFFMSKAKKRTNLLKSGIYISITNIVFLFASHKLFQIIFDTNLELSYLAYVVIFGKGLFLTPIFVTGIMPFFESLFNVTTDYRLLELSDISHPLLKELAMKAPGTYQHSLTVANLSESAAQAISANSLLARVGAYYHDIGKIIKPEYFIENQNYMINPHTSIKPSLSNSVLKAHVKHGLELAEKWKLPKPVKDIIAQHHAKTLMVFFYNEALKKEKDAPESEYRYSGPNPSFRESAILALADTIEAATRSLKNPTPARISEIVNNIFKKRINDGDLDYSELTLKEIKIISEVFVRILTTMYHTRIDYPKEEELEKNKMKAKLNSEK